MAFMSLSSYNNKSTSKGAFVVESSIQFSNTFIEDLLKVYEFAEKNSPYL